MAGKLVVPGETISEGKKPGLHAYSEEGKLRSTVVGLADEKGSRVIALKGKYMPQPGDWVIGVVQSVKYAGNDVDIKCPYPGFILSKMTKTEFALGDVVAAQVEKIDEAKRIDLKTPKRLLGGEILEVSSVKVPRIIGKRNSMLDTIMKGSGSEILVGRNGRIWLKGGNIALAVRAILMVEREAHTSGLTDRVAEFMKKESGDTKG